MIECTDYQVEISALLDGESDPATALELLAHVASCGSCGDVVRGFRAAQAGIDQAFPLEELVGAEVGSEEPAAPGVVPLRRPVRGPSRQWLWGIAATIAIAVGGYVAMDSVRPDAAGSSPEGEMVVRLGEDPDAMSDDRFFELTTELLRADRTYRDQMYSLLETVRTGAPQEGARTPEGAFEPEPGRESVSEPGRPTVTLD